MPRQNHNTYTLYTAERDTLSSKPAKVKWKCVPPITPPSAINTYNNCGQYSLRTLSLSILPPPLTRTTFLFSLSLIFPMDPTADSRPAVPWPGLETSPGRMMLAWGKGKSGCEVDDAAAYQILVD
jgi:hypothetical protein